MDTQLSELHTLVARVDERTIAIHNTLETVLGDQRAHEENDTIVHKDMNDRLGRVENNQRWFTRIASTLGGAALTVFGWAVLGG